MFKRKMKLSITEEDKLIEILHDWKNEVHSKDSTYSTYREHPLYYIYDSGKLLVITERPGLYIGRAGTLIDRYSSIIKREIKNINSIKIFEIKKVE